MCWVSWDRICQPKDRSGLGVKNLELFNNSLLCKGKWRGLSYSLAPWKNLLSFRYGSLVDNFLHGRGRLNLRKASIFFWTANILYINIWSPHKMDRDQSERLQYNDAVYKRNTNENYQILSLQLLFFSFGCNEIPNMDMGLKLMIILRVFSPPQTTYISSKPLQNLKIKVSIFLCNSIFF
jgi:hypothetical protein